MAGWAKQNPGLAGAGPGFCYSIPNHSSYSGSCDKLDPLIDKSAMAMHDNQLALFSSANPAPGVVRKYSKAEFTLDLCKKLILDHLANGEFHRLHERGNPTLRTALASSKRRDIAFKACQQMESQGLIEAAQIDDGITTHWIYKLRSAPCPDVAPVDSSDSGLESFSETLKARVFKYIAGAGGEWVSLFSKKQGGLYNLHSAHRPDAIKACQELESEGLIESQIKGQTQAMYRLVCDISANAAHKDDDLNLPLKADELVLTNQEFYESIQSADPEKLGQPYYASWSTSLERSLRHCLEMLKNAELFDGKYEAISRGLNSGRWSWSDVVIAFECLTAGVIPGKRATKGKCILVKPSSGSGPSPATTSLPDSEPVEAEVVAVETVAIVPAPPAMPPAVTDEAIDLSGLTLDELVYDEVKRNYALRQFEKRAARKILDGVCQSVGLQLPWLEVDGESYIPTDAVAELYGVERDSVNVTYNRKPALFAPITRRFDGEDLVCLKSRILSLSVIDSESITLRERWSEAVSQARNVIGFTALAVLGLSNISETPRAKIVNMAIIAALGNYYPAMERAAGAGKTELGRTMTNADIAELVYQNLDLRMTEHYQSLKTDLELIKSGVNDLRSRLGSNLYDDLHKLLNEIVSNFFQAEQWLMSAKKIENLVAAHADLNPTVRELLIDVQFMLKSKRAYVTDLVENDHIQFLWEHALYKGKCPVSYEQIVGEVDGEIVALKDDITGKKLGQSDHNFQVNKASHAMTWFVSTAVNQRLNHDEAYRDEVQSKFKVYQEELKKWLANRKDTGQLNIFSPAS